MCEYLREKYSNLRFGTNEAFLSLSARHSFPLGLPGLVGLLVFGEDH